MAEAKERGNALYKSGQFAEAVKAYDASLAIDPSVASVYANKAAALSGQGRSCLLYTSPSPRDKRQSRMPSSA